jgi:aspartate kinase
LNNFYNPGCLFFFAKNLLNMKVMKFGGTSLGNADRIKHVSGLISKNSECIVVCSAMTGVTNTLVDIAALWSSSRIREAGELTGMLRTLFLQTGNDLFSDSGLPGHLEKTINGHFDAIIERLPANHNLHEENWLLAQGEIVTSEIIAHYLNSKGITVTWLNALDFMRTGPDNEPSVTDIRNRLKNITGENPSGRFLTQGYICLDHDGNASNLKRGGSDYTATLLGAASRAEVIEIWTDIDGVRNNDPRFVEGTFPIRELSFDEAAELAYFGAKILHPSCVWPASSNNIPIQLKNTMDPDAPGTIISSGRDHRGITAVAAKEGITMIRIRSDRMLNAYGFLNRLFSIFEKYRTPIDVITTSEVAVSVTIDNPRHLAEIESELKGCGTVTVETGQAIVCVVGDVLEQHHDRAVKILDSVKDFNVKMISFGGSRNNITIVVPEEQRKDVLRSLNGFLFDNKSKNVIHG